MAQRKAAPTRAKKASTKAGRDKQAKTAAAADGKAKHTGLITKLNPIAKEINHKLEQAAKTDAKADDYRLSAALRLAEAKTMCEADKLPFKKWAEENVTQKFETVRKLVAIGAAKDPEAALADTRAKNKKANKKLRDSKASRDTKQVTAKPSTPFEQAEKGLAQLDDKARLNVLQSQASKLGHQVISQAMQDELKEYTRSKKQAKQANGDATKMDLATMQAAFDQMKARDQMAMVEYAADKVGAKIDMPFQTEDDGEVDLTIPDHLKR